MMNQNPCSIPTLCRSNLIMVLKIKTIDFDILNNTNEKNNEESQTTIKLNKNKELENNISQFEPKPTIEFSS